MGEIADDCYDRAMEELGNQEDPFFGCGLEAGYLPNLPYRSFALDQQRFSCPQRELPPEVAPNRDWKFVTIDKSWPCSNHGFLVQAPDLQLAIAEFFNNEYHQPYRHDKEVPDYISDVHMQTTGGWIIYGETQTVLIYAR